MKQGRYIWLVMLAMLCGSMAAQPRLPRPEIYLGAHAGVMGSTVLFNPGIAGMDILQSPLTWNGGLVFRYAGHKVCAIQLEANYMQRGWREKGEGWDYRRQLDYIEVPLLMHLYFGKPRFRGFVNIGPQVGYCIRDLEFGEKNPNYHYQYEKIDQRFDWGAAAGVGCYFRGKKMGVVQLEARFNYSLGGVFGTSKMDHFTAAQPMNVSVNLGYLWEMK